MRVIPAVAAVFALMLQLPAADMGFAQAEDSGFERSGLTLLLGSGVGINNDWPRGLGFAGPSLGIGGFASKNVAVMVRGTGVFSNTHLSYFTGLSMQYWMTNRFSVEGGPGVGVWLESLERGGEGFGLIIGASYTIIGGGMHGLQISAEYAFISDTGSRRRRVARSLGIVLRYQLF